MRFFIIYLLATILYANEPYIKQIKYRDECFYAVEPVVVDDGMKSSYLSSINGTDALKHCLKSIKKHKDDPHTLFLLARVYTKISEYQKGIYYAQYSCLLGDTAGCSLLGSYYFRGLGVKVDEYKAFLLYLSSCSQKDPMGCTNIAQIKSQKNPYSNALSKSVAETLLQTCINSTYPQSCELYANKIYFKEIPYNQDLYEYSNYKACRYGSELSCRLLKTLYKEYNIPFKKDKLKYVLDLSCRHGNQKACSLE